MKQNPQLSTTVDQDLHDTIKEMADKESRSISQMVAILLQQAVKRRLEKRKSAKEDKI